MPDSVADLDCEEVPARQNMTEDVTDDADNPGRPSSVGDTTQAVMSSLQPDLGALPVPYNQVNISHPDRLVDTYTGTKKIDLISYYTLVAPFMMPHLKDRPVSVVRAPLGIEGELFFQKHLDAPMEGIALLDRKLDPKHASLIEIVDPIGLLSAAQINVIEFHTWNSLKTAINTPDRMTFDLDPGAGVPWEMTQKATLLMCALLEQLGLPSFVKTSGGKGMHIVVPLQPLHDWKTVRNISHAIVLHAAAMYPMHFVAKSGAQNRIGKIYIDYLRNGFGATTVAAWSVRARPGLAISVPVARDEIAQLRSSAHWTVANIQTRLEQGNAPWNDYSKSAQSLVPVMTQLATLTHLAK
ncbi:non-homologous end-joining DNA ligase [Herminiimonas aquatilis]